jgi:hypothetical protein
MENIIFLYQCAFCCDTNWYYVIDMIWYVGRNEMTERKATLNGNEDGLCKFWVG